MLLNPYRFGLPPFQVGLVSYWKLDEVTGTVFDSHGTNHLADSYNPAPDVGKISGARFFSETGKKAFAKSVSGASLSTGDIDFTFAIWCRPNALAAMRPLITKWNDTGSLYEFKLFYDASPGLFTLDVRNTANTADGRVAASNFGVPPLNGWYYVICWHDSVGNQLGICVNNNTPNTTAWTQGVIAKPTMPFWIGARTGSAEYWNGQIDEVAFWKRILTPAERTALYNGGAGLAYPLSGNLTTNLVSYWKMDEVLGNALDAHGTDNLDSVNAVPSVAGKLNNAKDFEESPGEYLTIPSNASLQLGSVSFTFTAWVKFESMGGSSNHRFLMKYDGINNCEYWLGRNASTNRIQFMVNPTGTTSGSVGITANFSPSAGAWYFIAVWYDTATSFYSIQINNGSVDQSAALSVPFTGTAPFRIGSAMDGIIDEVGFWKRVLTPAERTEIYNSGNGLTYPFT